MKIYLGTDHAGYELKNHMKAFLEGKGYEVVDCGAHEYVQTDDYPDFCKEAARGVTKNKGSFGFVFGKSGTGEMIAANKVHGIRCAFALNEKNVTLAREHNDANMLSFGSEFVTDEMIEKLAVLFINTPYSNEDRHTRRITKLLQIETEECKNT